MQTIQWKSFPPPTSLEIDAFEAAEAIKLPQDYKSYLLNHNGGQPIQYVSFVIPVLGEKILLGVLYCLSRNDANVLDLRNAIRELKEDLPGNYIPIGEDPGGNLLLLQLDDKTFGEVHYWDRVGFLANRTSTSLHYVSGSITMFLSSLSSDNLK